MELLILDTELQPVDVVDLFESLIWVDRYDQCGDVELYLPITTSIIANLRRDYYLWNNDSEHLMIIEHVEIKTDAENGNHLLVSGRSAESLLFRRIVIGQKVYNGSLQDAVEDLLNDNIINPTDSNRKIDNFIFEKSFDKRIIDMTIQTQYNGDNLYEAIQSMCVERGIGFKVILDDYNRFVFSLYMGQDRTYNQLTNPYVVFSPDYDNIINSNYLEDSSDYKNVAYVQGEEGSKVIVGDFIGINRREVFVDASHLSRKVNGSDGNEVELTQEQYNEQLQQKGYEEISSKSISTIFDGEVEGTRMFKYREDYYIGDAVQVANEYGLEGVAYITEFIMSQNNEGISMYPTFKMN